MNVSRRAFAAAAATGLLTARADQSNTLRFPRLAAKVANPIKADCSIKRRPKSLCGHAVGERHH